MTKIIESRFRAMEFDSEDVLLSDIGDVGFPVHVNLERDEYSSDLQTRINELEPGNVIEAEIQSESISAQDSTWKFLHLEMTEETRFHFIEDAENHPSLVDKLSKVARKTSQNTARTHIKSDGEPIGFITVVVEQEDGFWNGLRMGVNTHEFDLERLSRLGGLPHEAIYTRTTDENRLIFYHFATKDTDYAESIVSALASAESSD